MGLIVMRPNEAYRRGLAELVEAYFPPGELLVGAEIGSFQGESAEILLSTGRFRTLYCVDAWTDGYDATDAASYQASQAEAAFDRRFRFEPRIVKVKGLSRDVAELVPGGLDFLYIDGCHLPEAVRQDLELYAPKVRRGGVLAGHDYDREKYPGLCGVVDEWLGGCPERVFPDTSWAKGI
jgi:hypothetical protein